MRKVLVLVICIMIINHCIAYSQNRITPGSNETGLISSAKNSKNTDSDKCTKEIELNLIECRKAVKVALDQKSGADSLKEDMNTILFCRHPLVQEKLSAQEQENLNFIWSRAEKAKGKITKKEIYELDGWASRFLVDCFEPYKVYSKQELETLDRLLKNIWNDMIKSLADNNIEKASAYFIDSNQDDWKANIEAFPPDKRKELVSSLQSAQVVMEKIQGAEATYQIITTENGGRYSFQLSLEKTIHGWKIVSF